MDPFLTPEPAKPAELPRQKIQFATAVMIALEKLGDLLLVTAVVGAIMLVGELLLWGLGAISDASGAGMQTAMLTFYGSWWLVGFLVPLLVLTIAVTSDTKEVGDGFLRGILATVGIFVLMALLYPIGWLLAACGSSIAWFGHLPFESWTSALITCGIAGGIAFLIVFGKALWGSLQARLEAERISREQRKRALREQQKRTGE